jgi:hypothetical protein
VQHRLGQECAGLLAGSRQPRGRWAIYLGCPNHEAEADHQILPTVLEYFPEIANESLPDDDAPSCSMAEALERQSLS